MCSFAEVEIWEKWPQHVQVDPNTFWSVIYKKKKGSWRA